MTFSTVSKSMNDPAMKTERCGQLGVVLRSSKRLTFDQLDISATSVELLGTLACGIASQDAQVEGRARPRDCLSDDLSLRTGASDEEDSLLRSRHD